MRTFLSALFLLGSAGSLAELVLLEHTEGYWQKVPLGLLTLGLLTVGASLRWPRLASARALRILMLVFVASGGVGLYQHYQGNLEFELEINPSRHGPELIWETLKGATPTLAPGMMIYLGLLGLGIGRLSSATFPIPKPTPGEPPPDPEPPHRRTPDRDDVSP